MDSVRPDFEGDLGGLIGGVQFKVTGAFYKILKQPPTEPEDAGDGAAYLFGPQFPLEEYEHLGI